jgi:hypothetical protein
MSRYKQVFLHLHVVVILPDRNSKAIDILFGNAIRQTGSRLRYRGTSRNGTAFAISNSNSIGSGS